MRTLLVRFRVLVPRLESRAVQTICGFDSRIHGDDLDVRLGDDLAVALPIETREQPTVVFRGETDLGICTGFSNDIYPVQREKELTLRKKVFDLAGQDILF